MKNVMTRRSCLAALIASGVSLEASWAEDPPTSIASNTGGIPVSSQSIVLKPIVQEMERTVITALAADPRGRFVAASGDDHAIRILDSGTLRLINTLPGHRDLIRTLAFDRAGKKLVSAGNDGQLIIWNRDDEFSIFQKMSGTPALACVRFSPLGDEIAAVGFDNRVYLIGRRSKPEPALRCDCSDLRAVAYRDDHKILAVAGRSGDLHLFDRDKSELAFDGGLHEGRIHAMAFLPESTSLVSVAEDGAVVVFDTERMKVVGKMGVTTGKLFAVSIIDARHIAVAGSDNIIRIIDAVAGRLIRPLIGHQGSIRTLCAYGGILFSGGFDMTLRRWSLTGLQEQERIAEGDPTVDRQ
jgi:WD40 repeat protein